MKLKELREKRARLIGQQKSLFDKAGDESRNLTNEEHETFKKIEADLVDVRNSISAAEALQRNLAELNEIELSETTEQRTQEDEPTYEKAFWRGMQFRMQSLSPEEQSLMAQKRTQVVGTDNLGGYTVPEGFSNELFREMVAWGGMLEVGRNYRTNSGNPIKWPINDDTANKGRRIGEGATNQKTNTPFASKMLNAYTYSSDFINVSMELMQDSAFDLPSLIQEIAAERLGRIANEELTTGTGTNMPEGVATAAGAGVTAAAQTAITRPELLGLIHSVDPRYRRRGTKGSRLMFNDATLADIKMLSFGSSDDRPLWQPSIREGEPDRIDGYSYSINQDMPDMAAGNRSILFGDFSKYLIRIIGRPVMMRLNERYAEELETAFLMYQRLDGRLLSSNAVKALTQAA